jgi:pimeloyl-ACP methyl ester carboxylesterase
MMERRSSLQKLTAASPGALAASSLRRPARTENTAQTGADSAGQDAKTSEFAPNATAVLVHAAWADGSCWRNVILPLERHGLQVICAPLPLTSLTNDTTALSWALERASGPVVLVGHGYSGAVIAAVNDDRVKSLVYISALAPDEGETVGKVFYLNPNSPEAPKMVPDSHGLVWLPRDAFHRALAQNASREEADMAAAQQRPIAVPCIQEPSPAPAWKTKPSWYLIAEEDRMIHPKTQRFMADRMHAKTHSHPVDHTAMYSRPQLVVDVILEAARETLSS